MQDEIELLEACTNLIALKKWEAFPGRLLDHYPFGTWIDVYKLCCELSLEIGELKLDLFVIWLEDPDGDERYVIIVFNNSESRWITAVHYERERLNE
jgi:hypothetical protein